jgi:hypothetical protein
MLRWARERITRLRELDLDGSLLESQSRRLGGMERVRVYAGTGLPSWSVPGVFARALMEAGSCWSRRGTVQGPLAA